MYVIIGIVTLLVGIIGGYLLEHGNLSVLWQPAELVIIGGAGLGAFFIMTPPKVVKAVFTGVMGVLKPSSVNKETCIELLVLLNVLFRKIRKEGLLALEADVNDPQASESFRDFKRVLANHHLMHFICDNFKVIISTNMSHHELDSLMDLDIEATHAEEALPASIVTKVADSLPALGIVAAVLGVVITMGKISEPPEVLGHSIGAALVGTFLGVLASYGFVGPIGTNMELKVQEEAALFTLVKTAIVSSVSGAAPQTAVEFGRRAIPGSARPSIGELEEAIKKWNPKA
jgi:chemotaxis protein MotA